MSHRCRVYLAIPGLVALAWTAFLGLPILAADYMLETPGESYTLTGEMTLANERQSVTKTLTVLEPGAVQNAPEGAILYHVTVVVDGDREERVMCLERREDGFYLVATAKKPGTTAKPEKEPQLHIPIPLEVGMSWKRVEGRKIELTWTIVEIDPESGLAHIMGEGSASVLGMKIPLVKESWTLPSGARTREADRLTILGKEAVTTLEQ